MESAKYDHLFGIYPVLYALRAGHRRFLQLWTYTPGAREKGRPSPKSTDTREEIVRLCKEQEIPIYESSRSRLDDFSEGRAHQGFVLKCRQRPVQGLFNLPSPKPGGLWVALQGITDPQNMGSVLRTSMFFKCDGVVYEHRDSSRLTPVVSKASSGAGEVLPLYVVNNLKTLLSNARAAGWRVLGTDSAFSPDGGPEVETLESFVPELEEAKKSGQGQGVLLVLGSEGRGLKPSVAEECEKLLRIDGGDEDLDSLNVGVAAGVTLHAMRSALGPPTKMQQEPAAATAAAEEEVAASAEGPVPVAVDAA